MKWLVRIALGILVLAGVALAGLFATGNGDQLRFAVAVLIGAPEAPFDPASTPPAPDYGDAANWAALPAREDLADLAPEGMAAVAQGRAPVDVFFVHPTGFMKGSRWIWDMDPETATEENTRWMLANQASVYNGCCNVYAPRYRQASLFAYFEQPSERDRILDFAYGDVERAFSHFLEYFSEGKPFLLASHSQGTHHAIRLLRERIDGTPLAERLVAAYLIGGGLPRTYFDALRDIVLCDAPGQTGCAVHWDTWSEAVMERGVDEARGNVCTNPLSWRLEGGRVGSAAHRGAVPFSGVFQLELLGKDVPAGVEFGPLGPPMPELVEAECRAGALFVTDLSDTPFERQAGFGGGNYHGLDYPLFHLDIRQNAALRVDSFLQASSSAEDTDGTATLP